MRAFYSGGNYNNTSYGLASFNGNNARSNTNTNIGFRSALPHGQMLQAQGPAPRTGGDKGAYLLARHGQKTYAAYSSVPATVRHSTQSSYLRGAAMEKHSRVFERFATFENLYGGYLLARRLKRYKREVLEYSAHLEDYLVTDLGRLLDKSYHTGEPRPFYEYYPKKRLIHSLPFNDRVINCAAYLQLWPIYSKSFYEHSYGSVPNKGTVKAVRQLQKWMQMVCNSPYDWRLVKKDVAKFFFRIPQSVQLRELGRPLDDPDMMWFLKTAIEADGRPLGLPLDCTDVATAERISGIGMQVGSLISQTTANVVLTPLDHYIKRVLKVPYYIRYMDDMVSLCRSKQEAWDVAAAVDEFLRDGFGLQLNHKTAVLPVRSGVEFIGRHIYVDKVLLRKETTLRLKRHLNYVMEHYALGKLPLEYCLQVFQSYMGLLKHTNSDALKQKLIEDFVLVRNSEQYHAYVNHRAA